MSNLKENENFKGTLNEFIKIIKASMYSYFVSYFTQEV